MTISSNVPNPLMLQGSKGILAGLDRPTTRSALTHARSWSKVNNFFSQALFVSIPLTVGIAIMRYRLWDIDTIINRALVYGSFASFLRSAFRSILWVRPDSGKGMTTISSGNASSIDHRIGSQR